MALPRPHQPGTRVDQGATDDAAPAGGALKGLAFGIVALNLVLTPALVVALHPRTHPDDPLPVVVGIPSIAFTALGALVLWRRPTHLLGWTFLSITTFSTAGSVAENYARIGLVIDPGSLPAVELAAWVAFWSSLPPWFMLATALLLLYPDGHLPSRAWRPVGGAAVAAVIFAGLWAAFGRATDPALEWTNPLAVPALAPLRDDADLILGTSWFALGAASLASLAIRFRRSRGVERQQLKWFLYAAGLFLAAFVVLTVLTEAGSPLAPLVEPVAVLSFLGMPVAIGIAVLRHQLFDIDLLINRTLVYGLLTATLGSGYWLSILALQAVISPVTQDNGLVVAAATLLAAALFRPARDRIQATVDRRFYRSRYDAGRLVEAFGGQLRREVDLGSVTDDLLGVASGIMRPTGVALWLRGGPPTSTRLAAPSPRARTRGV